MKTTIKLTGIAKLKSLTVVTAVTFAGLMSATNQANAGEVMNDHCSSRVAIPTTGYNAKPDEPGTVILIPAESGWTPWTQPFTITKAGGGHIRWWCNSTKGNPFDLGTYSFKFDLPETLRCAAQIGGKVVAGSDVEPEDLRCVSDSVKIKPGASAYNGWTPERSRCGDRSNLIRARMGPSRRLQIECLGRVSHDVAPATSALRSFSPTSTKKRLTACDRLRNENWHTSKTLPLVNYWSRRHVDNALMVHPHWRGCPGHQQNPDYKSYKIEGLLFKTQSATSLPTVPLYHYWSHNARDNAMVQSLTVPGLSRQQQPNGYRYYRTAGYIVAPTVSPTSNMLPLYTLYSPERRDFFTTTQSNYAGRPGERKGGYIFVRLEGYVLKAQ